MRHPSGFRAAPRRAWALNAALFAAALLAPTTVKAGEPIKPWIPPAADSLTAWAAEARVAFQLNAGDSVAGANFHAYDLVGRMGRLLLRSLGKSNVLQAPAMEAVIDSMGLDTEVAIDPRLPDFVLMLVRNPFRISAGTVGFLFWYRGNDLRIQGAEFHGGRRPVMRVWWSGAQTYPYEWGVVDRSKGPQSQLHFKLFRMSADGLYWNLAQYDGHGPDLGEASDAVWADLNHDDLPELVAWAPAPRDSLMSFECTRCPSLLTEQVFVERPEGFTLHDTRLLPSPYSSFVLFLKLLQARNHGGAARLLTDPTKLDEAIALGWEAHKAPGTWQLDYSEPNTAWPIWLAMKYRGDKGEEKFIIHFTQKEGRWIIKDWIRVEQPHPEPGAPTQAPAARPGARTATPHVKRTRP